MKPTILVIEDDPIAAKLMQYQLERKGYQILIASNGVQGVKMIQVNPPDLLLLDLMLPGLDGFEVLNRLRADPQTADLPVVIVSAKSQPGDKQMAARIGANAYLTKPYDRAELLALIRSLLSERQEKAAPCGTCVVLVAPHEGEAAPVALYVGLALAGQGKTATAVDFHPFSIAHSLLLDLPPRLVPVSLSDPETASQLVELAVHHSSGLRLLNNLEGSGEGGQFTSEDVQAMLNTLLHKEGFVLADVPLYPVDVLRQTAGHCAQMLLVTRNDPVSLGATHSALTMIQRASVDMERLGIVFIGMLAKEPVPKLGQKVLGRLPAEARPDDPAFHALAGRLLSLA